MEKRDNKQELDIAILQNNYKTMSDKIDSLTAVVRSEFSELRKELKENYVSNDKFEPVRMVVYGLVGVVLLGALTAMLTIIYK